MWHVVIVNEIVELIAVVNLNYACGISVVLIETMRVELLLL